MSDSVQALYVTLLGMGLVFVSLGILMLIIIGLQYLLRDRRAVALAGAPTAESVPFTLDTDPSPLVDETAVSPEVVAAIAVAIAVWRRRQEAAAPPQTTVVTFSPGSAAWRAQGRLS